MVVASGGGHWAQLRRVWPAFAHRELVVVTTEAELAGQVDAARRYVVTDANLRAKLRLGVLGLQVAWIVLRERPGVVISTGAAPGYFAVRVGKWLGARTVWVDSIANAEQLSVCGDKIGRYADLWLTQWEHLAGPDGPVYRGAVL